MLDASLHYIVMRRYPERLAERAGKMMNRQLCNFGEHFQSDIFLQMQNLCIRSAVWHGRMLRFEGRTGSRTWNKVKSQRARAANRNRPDSGVVRLCAAGRAPLNLAAAHG